MQYKVRLWVGLGIAALAIGLTFPARYLAQTAASGVLFVHGHVVATLSAADQQTKHIALPGVVVQLVTSPAGALVTSTTTDLSGRFILKTKARGSFQLCTVFKPYERTCTKSFGLARSSVSAGQIELRAPLGKAAAAYGSVRLRDGRLARGFAPYLDVNAYPIVELSSKAGTYRTAVNNFGEYVVPELPLGEDFKLTASIEGEQMQRAILAQSNLAPGRAYPLDFVLTNAAPRVRLVSAMQNGKPVQLAAPGSTLTLHAVADDPDGDKLEYRWRLPDGVSYVGPNSSSELTWKVPSQKGRYPVYVVVSDGRGGHSESSLLITAATGNTRFTGSVVDSAGHAIGGATVNINGRLTNTSATGTFKLNVPVRDKYIMSIQKPGIESPGLPSYGNASFVYKAPILGGRWTLRPAQVVTVDPTQPISVQQQRDGRCAGLVASTLDWKSYSSASILEHQDGRGNVTSFAELGARDPASVRNLARLMNRVSPSLVPALGRATGLRLSVDAPQIDCSRGVKVEIPANALQDASGAAPSGKIQLSMSSIDLTADQMPGDYSAFDMNNKAVAMESFGAGSFELGAGRKRYNLKPGTTAKVTIPVDGTQLAGGAPLPATIPFMYYDETLGTWHQEKEAVLTGSGASAAYVMKVPHFSTMNADILKTGQSCVAVELDPASGFTLPLPVEVVMQPSQVAPGVIQVRTLTLDSSKSNVIYNLPNNSDIVLTPIIPGTLPDGSAGNVPAGVFVVNTGGPQSSAVTPPAANPDGTYYAEAGGVPTGPCASRVTLRQLGPVTLANGQEFLQGLSFQSSNIDEFDPTVANEIESGALDYYDQADPRQLRASFNAFKLKNRFGQALAAGEAEYDAQFANGGDLGFGRDMHCRRNQAGDGQLDYACYVTNYGQPPANNPDQQDAEDVLDPAHIPDATVAMEFSRVENAAGDPIEFPDDARAVKFYVYDTKNPDTLPIIKADLDGHGQRPIPQLCMVCHGGQLASEPADPINDPTGPKKGAFSDRSDIIAMGANFLPFDLHYYKFPAAKNKATQQAAIKNLNVEIVKPVSAATGTGAAIVSLIDDALYFGGSAAQLENEVIGGWDTGSPNNNPDRFYRDVFARTCRTCHVSSPFGAPVFTDRTSFEGLIGNVQLRVCSEKVMPHAQRTNDIFWNSLGPSMPGLLELYGQTLPGWSALDTAQCGLAYQPGGTAPSVFADQIYRILFNECASCHSTTGNANFAVTDVAGTYTSLLTATANDGVSHYIVPSNTGSSKLYQRILGVGGSRMPLGGPDLTTTDTDMPPDGAIDATEIQAWINAGAVGP